MRLKDCFQFKNHLCLVFELLSINLYELLKQNQFRGLPLPLIRHFIKQILEVTGCNSCSREPISVYFCLGIMVAKSQHALRMDSRRYLH